MLSKLQSRQFSVTLRDMMTQLSPVGNPQGRLLVLGAGWAGYQLVKNIDKQNYDVSLMAPKNFFTFTPLLASASVGTLELRSTIESARLKNVKFFEAECKSIDFDNKTVQCVSTSAHIKQEYTVAYDKLVIACGAISNTFNVPGVTENACFLKDVSDARKIRSKLLECFERASHPLISDTERARLLHFAVVGGGPTGVEFCGELYDFVFEDVGRLYTHLRPYIKLSIYDGAKKLLPTFEKSMGEYTENLFRKRGINVHTGVAVRHVDKSAFTLRDGSVVPYGLLMWSTGVAPNALVRGLDLPKDRMQRIFTDDGLRVLDHNGNAISGVFALGDCATVKEGDLPCTAQVARQKAEYLYKSLNRKAKARTHNAEQPFQYKHKGSMAYVGGWRAVVDMDSKNTKPTNGILGWLIWRTAYLSMAESLRNKISIPTNWLLTWISGREISRFH